jgi:hypothetical protein
MWSVPRLYKGDSLKEDNRTKRMGIEQSTRIGSVGNSHGELVLQELEVSLCKLSVIRRFSHSETVLILLQGYD